MAKMKNMIIAIGLEQKGLRKMNKQLRDVKNNFRRDFGAIADSVKNAGRSMSMSITAPLALMGVASVKAFDMQAKAIAQVEAGLKSTGAAVGYTSEQLQKMASDLQNKTIFGDEEILKDATAQLLTFTNIAGANFARTQKVALDLATRLDGDLKSASIQLGKALNDPVANLTALSRAGIQFSKDQKSVIKSLTETGNLAEAQTIILDELEKQYGGSAEAAAAAGMGPFKQLANSVSDLSEEFGRLIAGALAPLVGKVRTVVTFMSGLSDSTKRTTLIVAAFAASIGPVLMMLPSLAKGIHLVGTALKGSFGPAMLIATVAIGALQLAFGDLKKEVKEADKEIVHVTESIEGLNRAQLAQRAGIKLSKDLGIAMRTAQKDVAFWAGRLSEADKEMARLNDQQAEYQRINRASSGIIDDQINSLKKYRSETQTSADAIGALVVLLGKEAQGHRDVAQSLSLEEYRELNKELHTQMELRRVIAENNADVFDDSPISVFASSLKELPMVFEEVGEAQEEMWDASDEALAANGQKLMAQGEAYMGFAQSLSGGIQGIFSKLAQGTQTFGQIMGDMLKQLLIKLASMAAAFLLISMLTGGAGGAAMNFGSFMKAGLGMGGGIPKLASGGLVSGPTLAVVGDNKNAMADPEVVAPLSKLKNMMGGQGGGHLTGRISGRDIVLASHRDQRGARRVYTAGLT
jgi:hypothetical protein